MPNSSMTASSEWLRAAVRGLRRRRVLVLSVAWIVALAATLAIPLVPERYEASARLYVDTQSVLKPLMAGLAYEPDIDLQLRMLARTVISRPNIEAMLDRKDLQLQAPGDDREQAIATLMEKIKLSAVDNGNLYTVSYRDTDAQRAQRVVAAIVDLFVGSSARDKRRDSQEASRFIEIQIHDTEAKLIQSEDRLKEFKLRHFGVSGVSNQDYFSRISVISDELGRLRADLRAAEQSRDAFRRELDVEDPQLPVHSEVDAAIAQQKRQLAELLRRFTENHPDVIAARAQIADLEAQKLKLVAGPEAHSAEDPKGRGVAATSPIYQRLRVSLAEAEALVGSLRSRVAINQQRLDEVRSTASRVPQVEAELAQLNRDYDVIRKNYDQLVVRRESASLGLKIDESSPMADFQLVEPPRVTPKPVFPSHWQLALIGIALSLVSGLLAPLAVDAIRPTFESANVLRQFSGRPVLGTISVSMTGAVPRRHSTANVALALAFGALLVMQSAWLAWVAMRPPFLG